MIEDADFVVAHNDKYEAGWLQRMGLDLRTVLFFCTKLGEYVLMGNLAAGDERMLPRSTSLDDCCRRRGWKIKDPAVDMMMKHGINPLYIPRPWLQGRCEQDVETTEDLFLDQRERLANTNRLAVLLTRCLLTPVLASVEFEGMCLDEERVAGEFQRHTDRLAELEHELNRMTGGINWRSPKQLAEYLYDVLKFQVPQKYNYRTRKWEDKLTKAGNRPTDKQTLESLKPKTEKQKEFIELRKEIGRVNAALTKSLQFFQGICKEKDGIFHAVFNQTVTATHRLSSSGIPTYFELYDTFKTAQFQNLARAFKPLFRAKRDGWLIGEWDGSQLEFRTAVELSGDKQGTEDILNGHDVHKFTGSWIYHAPEEWLGDIAAHIKDAEGLMDLVTDDERQYSKPHTFKPTYGGKSGTKREKAYYEAFQARYGDMTRTQQGWVYEVLNSPHKSLQTVWGMRYYWPYAQMKDSGYCNVTSSVYNYPIQAFATAEIIPIAIVYFWHRLAERNLQDVIRIVNTVHDSVIGEIHPDYVKEFETLAVDIWADVYRYLDLVYGFKFRHVPLGTEVVVGTHWANKPALYKQAYNIFADGRIEKDE